MLCAAQPVHKSDKHTGDLVREFFSSSQLRCRAHSQPGGDHELSLQFAV